MDLASAERMWYEYFFERHSKDELKEWAKELSLFRYFRAYGGHANDGDSLDLAIKYKNVNELIYIFGLLGVNIIRYDSKPDQPISGKPYSGEEFDKFPSLIPNTKWIKQPCWTTLCDIKVFIFCSEHAIKITVNSNPYEVIQEDIEHAKKLEQFIKTLKVDVIDPPFETKHYLCPKYHKDLFE